MAYCAGLATCIRKADNVVAFGPQALHAKTEEDGEMAEWPIAPVLKTGSCASGTGVRIPLSPISRERISIADCANSKEQGAARATNLSSPGKI